MGYRGKVQQQEQARAMRACNMTLQDIATELGVAKSSVSLWVRDVPFTPSKRRAGPQRRPHPAHEAKLAQSLSDAAFLAAGAALYAGEGTKGEGAVRFANSDPKMIQFFCAWFRRFFEIDETRLRGRVYLHQGLDIDAATAHWSEVTGIPVHQFRKPYRALPDPTIRRNKHEFGCGYVDYLCSTTHRQIMGLVRALLSSDAIPG